MANPEHDSPVAACDDPIVLAEIERALKPYRAILTPELLQVFREELMYMLTEHPGAKTLVDRMRERPVLEESGEVEKVGKAPSGKPKKAESGGGR